MEKMIHLFLQRTDLSVNLLIRMGRQHQGHDLDLLVIAGNHILDGYGLIGPADRVKIQIPVQIEQLFYIRQRLVCKQIVYIAGMFRKERTCFS